MGRQIVHKQRNSFAEKAMQIRLQKGIKQIDISNRLGYKSNEYARIESGFRPMRYQLIPNLCEILGVPNNTFDDVTENLKPDNRVCGAQIYDRLEEIRTEVLDMDVPEFCKAMQTTSKNYHNIKIAQHPVTKYMRKLIGKYCFKDPRLSYSYILEGKISQETQLKDSLNEAKIQLQQAKARIQELENLAKRQAEKIKDLEVIKSLATKMFMNA